MELREIVPWGRSFEEYRRMFALTESDLAGRTIGCGDGPASFNAEATAAGHAVVSCDPIYSWLMRSDWWQPSFQGMYVGTPVSPS
jgi:hypothetical protein